MNRQQDTRPAAAPAQAAEDMTDAALDFVKAADDLPPAADRTDIPQASPKTPAGPQTEKLAPKIPQLRHPLLWAALPVVVMAAVLLLRYPFWNTGWPQDSVQSYFAAAAALTVDGRLDINTADFTALCTLPGIGEVKAQAILDYRAAHGPFAALEELLEVSGIGEKTLEGLREYIYIGTPPAEETA